MWDTHFFEKNLNRNCDCAIDSEILNLVWLDSLFVYMRFGMNLEGMTKTWKITNLLLYRIHHNREPRVAIMIPLLGHNCCDHGGLLRLLFIGIAIRYGTHEY